MSRHRHKQRTIAACNASVEADRVPEFMPTMTLDQEIARARHEMGEFRWLQLQCEWEGGPKK